MSYLSKVILGAGVGVLAIAAAPFTGGGSVLAAGTSLASSLAGTGTLAMAAGTACGLVGAANAKNEAEQDMARTKEAKKSAFNDGINEGKALSVNEIKKFTNFYLATTALSYYVARCDGNISIEEEQEIAMDLDAITKNLDIPDAVKNEIKMIMDNANITFKDVMKYLDNVSLETLKILLNDVNEIIEADDVITKEEEHVRNQFTQYLKLRETYE